MEQHEHHLPFSSTAIWIKRTRTWNHTYSSLLWCTWKGIIVDKIASPTTTQQIHVVRSLKDRRTSKKDPHNFGLKPGILPRFFVNPSYHWHPVHQWHQCRTSRISFDPSLVWQKLSCGSTRTPRKIGKFSKFKRIHECMSWGGCYIMVWYMWITFIFRYV